MTRTAAILLTAAIALLLGFAVFREGIWRIEEILQATLGLILIVIIFNRFLPFVFFMRTKGQWLAHWVIPLRIVIYLAVPATLVLGFLRSVTALTKEHSDEQPETQAEAVDALIEAGREEGILDESNRDLIQSVVEFGEKVHAKAVTAGGESGNPSSPHFNDQAKRYGTGDLREVYFYPSDLKGHIERQYHPGE